MKHYLYIIVFIFLQLLGCNNMCWATDGINKNPIQVGTSNVSVDSTLTKPIYIGNSTCETTALFPAFSSVDFSLLGMRLIADTNSLMHDAEFYASSLHKEETELLDNVMVNVTAGCYAYRLLPHGTHFSKPALLEMTYEPLALPSGFSPEDIYTYYYDNKLSNWQRLQRVMIDTIQHVVISSTTHFTDFINAVIRTPDIPEVSAFAPTTFSEVEEPHPFENRVIVGSPMANTYGSAEIAYPLAIPSGRNGLQPNIDLSYNSNNGPSFLGDGWSLSQPAITIDTRWGVPRYDNNYETEMYTLNGVQIVQKSWNDNLTLQYQTHNQIKRRGGGIDFISRDKTNNDKITRYGTTPKNYWWRVIDKNGTTYYYGKYQSDRNINNACILKDDEGNIAYWALTEVVDLNGNYIRYEYDKSEGNEIYLTYIYYTGHRNAQGQTDLPPSYRIRLHYDDSPAADNLQSDCRLGFVRKSDRTICFIDESYIANFSDTVSYVPFIRYFFSINTNSKADKKQHLTSIRKYRMPKPGEGCDKLMQTYGEDWCYMPMECGDNAFLLNYTRFEYYDSSTLFEDTEHIIQDSGNDHNNLFEARAQDWSLGGTLTVGLGPDAWTTNISAGGNYNFSKSKGDVDMLLLDMNGDGLADKVYIKNDSIYYRKQILSEGTYFFSLEQNTGIPARSLNHEVSKTNSWGLQAGAAAPKEIAGANISGGWSLTNTQVSNFFADVNGDGLPDYIDNGTVYFNRLNSYADFRKHKNEYQIIIDSTQCSPYFYYNGQVNAYVNCHTDSLFIGSYTADGQRRGNNYPYNQDCAILCNEYVHGRTAFQELCETCLRTTPIYLDRDYNIITEVDNDFCNDHYNYYLNEEGASRLCPECLMYLLEEYGRDIDAYIECANSCQQADTALYWYLKGCCYHMEECPTEECSEHSKELRDDCKDCVNGIEICEECIERCQNGDYYDCNECKREFRCNGVIQDYMALDVCYTEGHSDCDCINTLYDVGEICEECLEICKFHPELCLNCINRYCEYISEEEIAEQQIDEWKENIRASHPNALFVQTGWTVTAYDTLTVCPSPEEEIAPNMEAVRVWVAPKDGIIRIISSIQLIEDNTELRSQSRSVDGVNCVIQHDKQVHVETTPFKHLTPTATDIIDIINLSADDYSSHSNEYMNIPVHKGDVLSFHLMSKQTHSFDNVDWTQHLYYYNMGGAYYSDQEYICSSKETFQYDALGHATIEFWADVQNGGSATVKIMKGNNTHSTYDITPGKNTHISCNIYNIKPDKDNALYLTLSSSVPNKVHVRAKVTFNHGTAFANTITKWLIPEVSLPAGTNNNYDDIYYDLFGPLYRGWGQYAFNNKYASTIIPLDSLFNPYKKTYESVHNDTASYRASIVSIAEMDTAQIMENPDSMEDAFNQNQLYDPLSHMWIEMSANAETYQWEAYGKVARIGKTTMSNTRDESQLAVSSNATSTDDDHFDFYDNAVPKPEPGTRIMAVRKESKTKLWNLSYGANLGGVAGIGRSKSKGTYKLQTDFMDMNGDRYPDIVHETAIQYTKPWGGLGETRNVNAYLHETQTTTEGCSFSGNFGKTVKQPGGVKNDLFTTSVSGSSGVGSAHSYSEASFMLVDVNNDGLPDKLVVNEDSTYIYLNLGYNFILYKVVALDCLNQTYSESLSGDVGFSSASNWGDAVKQLLSGGHATNNKSSMYQASISAGCSASTSTNKTKKRLIDINGNGRLDLIEQTSSKLYVTYNILDKNYYATTTITQPVIQQSTSKSAGLNLALTGGYTFFGILKVCAGIQTIPINISETLGTHDLIDMNGDGLPDLVRVHDNKIYVRYNTSGKRGLLRSIQNITGNHIELDYTLSLPSTDQPHRQMLLTSVKNIDDSAAITGGIPIIEKRFIYMDPHYDAAERQSYGYGYVATHDMYPADADDTARVYRKRIQRFQNQEFAEHGKLIYDALMDSLDNLYTEYELGTIYYDAAGHITENTCKDTKIRIGKEAHYTRYYEGTDEPITTAKIYEYDTYHNVIKYENIGDSAISEDDLLANITYEKNTQYINKHLISLPTKILVNATGQNIRQITAEYTPQGNLSKHIVSSCVNGNDTAIHNYSYDNFGLLSQVLLPSNHKKQRGCINISYDSITHSLPYKITNHFGQSQTYNYSVPWQKPVSVTDPAGNCLTYEYDDHGRLISVTAPQERLESKQTISYDYGTIDYYSKELYVDTKTYSDGDSTEQYSVYDQRGLLRLIQKYDGSHYLISYHKVYDNFGRISQIGTPTRNHRPYQRPSPPDPMRYSRLLATYTYDICDRQTSVQWNDANQTTSTTQYLLGNDYWGIKRLKTLKTDENGKQWQTFIAPQGWTTTTIAPDNATTGFVYDALGQLVGSTDPDGLTTSYLYNGLGRQTQRRHPDAGTTRWQYDPAGNIIVSQTQRQIDAGQQTTYHYTYNQLDSICYQGHSEADIIYNYDSISGRLNKRTDISGYERFDYDAMGNITLSERLISLPQETKAYKFTTKYNYDSFGKIRHIIYPDSEDVSYHYRNGFLKQITGSQKTPTEAKSYTYIDDIQYDFYNRYRYVLFGNDYTTSISYDPVRLWMTGQTISKQQHTLLDVNYEYDAVGNIYGIDQTAERPSWFGGPYTMLYEYDTQNRLIKADMVSDYFGEYSNYTMNYSPSGLVGLKSCNDMLWNYWYGYNYDANTNKLTNHQVRSIYDMENDETTFLQWDADGQLLNILQPCSGNLRHHWWNDAGQMIASVDNEHCGYYGYDGNGERAYKLTGQSIVDQYNAGEQNFRMYFNDAVLYVNPYMVVTPKGYTKHYYDGSRHIAAQIGALENLPDDIIDTSAVALERIANAQAYMNAVLNISEPQEADTESVFADIEGDAMDELQWQCDDDVWTLNATIHCDSNLLYPILTKDTTNLNKRVSGIFYYHPDQLGSATWITNDSGNPIEFIHYMPFGELWYDQQASAYNERFKFTGKERDGETNYDFFGARYYSSAFPMWLSVDPLANKYPNISPYAYCHWNPMKYVDPDGNEVINKMNPVSDKTLYDAGNNLVDLKDNHIFFVSHGSSTAMYPYGDGQMTANSFVEYLSQNSDVWNNTEDKSSIVITLVSCETGKGDNPIAQQISKLIPEATIVAPTEEVKAAGIGEEARVTGVAKSEATTLGETKKPEYAGQWKAFRNGEQISTSENGKVNYIYRDEF